MFNIISVYPFFVFALFVFRSLIVLLLVVQLPPLLLLLLLMRLCYCSFVFTFSCVFCFRDKCNTLDIFVLIKDRTNGESREFEWNEGDGINNDSDGVYLPATRVNKKRAKYRKKESGWGEIVWVKQTSVTSLFPYYYASVWMDGQNGTPAALSANSNTQRKANKAHCENT